MRSLLKKTGDKASAARAPAWHPNFRDAGHLPDTKTVRTTFFINAVTGTLAAALLLVVIHREYNLHEIQSEISLWEAKVATDKPVSDRAVANYKQFQAEEKKVGEVAAFTKQPLVFSDLLIRLGGTLPKGVRISRVNYTGNGLGISGVVEGIPEQASGMVSNYVDLLRRDEGLSKVFGDVNLTSMSRSADGGRITMELNLKKKAPPAAKPAPKPKK